jgi:hypothetical protein
MVTKTFIPFFLFTLPFLGPKPRHASGYFLRFGERGMDFTLTTEQQMIRDLCKNFVKNEIAPIAEEMD